MHTTHHPSPPDPYRSMRQKRVSEVGVRKILREEIRKGRKRDAEERVGDGCWGQRKSVELERNPRVLLGSSCGVWSSNRENLRR